MKKTMRFIKEKFRQGSSSEVLKAMDPTELILISPDG
jgi:hypothetical protein